MYPHAKNDLWTFVRGVLLAWMVVLLAFAQSASAQQPLYYNINTDDGLPSNEVFEIDQDRFGHVWIGCNTGLYRYDGVHFERYGSRFETSRAMIMLRIDSRDRIWCGNVSGQYFVKEGDSLRLIFSHDAGVRYECVTVGRDGDLLVLQPDGIQRINWDGKVVQNWKEEWDWNASGFPTDICWRGEGVNVLLSNGKAVRYQLSTFRLEPLEMPENLQAAGSGAFGTKGEAVLAKYLRAGDGFTSLQMLDGNRFHEIYAERVPVEGWLRIQSIAPGRIWVCTQFGAKELRLRGNEWEVGPVRVPEAQVSAVMADHEGNLWFSSINKGLFVLPSAGAARFGEPGDPLWDANVTALCTMSDGALLVGNSQGEVYALDSSSEKPRLIMKSSPKARAVKRIRRVGERAFVLRSENSFIDWPSGKVRPYHYGSARDGLVVGDSVRLIGSQMGWTYPLNGWESLTMSSSRRNVGGRAVEQEPGSGLVYWGHNDGLFVRRDTGYQEVQIGGRPIIANALAATENGVWVGTLTQGLVLCKEGKVVQQINARQGLPDQAIRTLVAHAHFLIFGTDQYLCRLDLANGSLRKVSRSAGFSPTDINQIAVAGDRVWLGTTTGLVSLPLDFGKESSVSSPPVRIGRVRIGDQDCPVGEELDLPAGHAPLHATFEGISFNSRGRFAFAYRIPTMDSAWVTTPAAANEVIFTALPAGEHRLEVVTVDEQGRRSAQPSVLRFRVASPVFLRPWFMVLMAFFLIGITIVTAQLHNQIQRRKDRLRYAMVASQLTALKAQMNPHFLFNSLNSIQDLVLSKDIRNSNLYLSKFSTLMRRVLAVSGEDWIAIGDEVEMLQLYLELEQLRFGEEFSFEIEVGGMDNASAVKIPTMVLQPFVENAIKHGLLHKRGVKRLEIRFAVSEATALVRITDNGVGRKRSAEIQARSGKGGHAGFSTAATVKRMDLIQQMHGTGAFVEIEDLLEDGEAAGTRVVLQLPVH